VDYELDPLISRYTLLVMLDASREHYSSNTALVGEPVATRPAWSAILNPDFVQRIGLAERYRAWRQHQPGLAKSEREATTVYSLGSTSIRA
jgi:hypothetical protein